MGGCFSLQNEHDIPERQNVATENVIQIPVEDQHQQPGAVSVTLCQSIYDFFKECLPCIGGSGNENQCTVDAWLNILTSFGLSQEEVALMISKAPLLLALPEKLVSSKMEFLMKEAGCDKLDVIRNPSMLTYSLENMLIPRNIVRKLLISKEPPPANLKFTTFLTPTDEKFVDKFVLPYEHVIPGLH